MIQLSIIIVNYKNEDLTINFVNKELSKIQIPHITVVVNNEASEESNSQLCQALNAQVVTSGYDDSDIVSDIFILPSDENLGFAKGNNLGVIFSKKYFKPKYYLFANNDIQITDTKVVEKLISKLDTLNDAGIIGPQVIGLDGENQSPYPYRSFWDSHIWIYWSTFVYSKQKKIRKFEIDYPERAKEGFHYYVMGSFFLVRASDFYDCGMFDPSTFLYAEEMILSERMRNIGKKVFYYPGTNVIHAHGLTTKKFGGNKINDWMFESECYYYKTYRGVKTPLICLAKLTRALMKLVRF